MRVIQKASWRHIHKLFAIKAEGACIQSQLLPLCTNVQWQSIRTESKEHIRDKSAFQNSLSGPLAPPVLFPASALEACVKEIHWQSVQSCTWLPVGLRSEWKQDHDAKEKQKRQRLLAKLEEAQAKKLAKLDRRREKKKQLAAQIAEESKEQLAVKARLQKPYLSTAVEMLLCALLAFLSLIIGESCI